MDDAHLVEEINRLKEEKNAVVLVHNYQRPEIYDVGDYLGDSLELARAAVDADAETIVFCGVDFMAETAKILNPEKKVLIPNLSAVCPMSQMVSSYDLKQKKKQFPDAPVVCYVNTSAEVKAESDICCTSANAVDIVNSLSQEEILFVPDSNLGAWVEKQTGKKIIKWSGYCRTHAIVHPSMVKKAMEVHPSARVVAHPECEMEVLELADKVCGTGGMIKYAKESYAQEFIIVTEAGMVNRLKKEVPGKRFYAACGSCMGMKTITLDSVLESLEQEDFEISLKDEVMEKAKNALDRMLELS